MGKDLGYNKKMLLLFSVDHKQDDSLSPGALSVPDNMINVHKRSSSDAGVSYHVRPNRNRRAARRKEYQGYQIIDQEGVSMGDGRSKNIQNVLVSIGNF